MVGHSILLLDRWHDTAQHTGTAFAWEIYVISEDTHGTEDSFSAPDGLWIDPEGRVFIQTDGGQQDGLQDQMIIGNIFGDKDADGLGFKRLIVGVSSDEITASASSTSFPAPADGVTIPRDATLVLRRKGGGVVGS